MSTIIQKLIKQSKDPKLIGEVFEFAKETYKNKKWLSGEDYYIDHATRIALILSDMGIDQTTIAGGLLYGVTDTSLTDTKKSALEEIKKKFGPDVARLVQKTSELNKIYYSFRVNARDQKTFSDAKNENLRKMFFAIAQDLGVILIKIASRIDGLSRLDYLPPENKILYANETLQIFVPIANRLGLGEIKTKLEDLAFEYLYPAKFKWLQENIKERYEERQKYLKKFIPHLKKILARERIKFSNINYRAKSYWGTYQKLLTYNMDFEKIHDLVALRVVVKDVSDCYRTLGIIHKYYKPISGRIKDYIAKPKLNGYKSLHTDVIIQENKISEVQIKTEQMQKDAEYGVCAHWSYKEHVDLQKEGEKFKWINPARKNLEEKREKVSHQLPSKKGISNGSEEIPEFWNTFKIDFFSDEVFTFTPRGDIIALPMGSTPIDFAYAVHSYIGDHCESAKIDGKIIALNQPLKNGDVVEIITNKKRAPSYDWLRFVKTNFAKSHIRKIVTIVPASIFSVSSFVTKKIFGISKKAVEIKRGGLQIQKEKPREIYLAGQKGILVNTAKCCLPQPGDQAMAYLTMHRAAVLHKISCNNLKKLSQKFPEKIIDASWHQD